MKKRLFLLTPSIISFFVLSFSIYVRGQHVSNCFASDPAMGSTNRNDHYNWAQGKDGSQLAANVKLKLNLFYNCPSADDYTLRASFANVSAIIGKSTQNISCFANDPGAKNADVLAHYDWAKTKSRQQLLENLQGKIAETFKCLSSQQQKTFFADLSVSVAQTVSKLNTGSTVIQNGGNNQGITKTGEWNVWVKTSPCTGRNDWISVAKENPTGGGNFFYLANQIFPGTACTNMGCTFAEATTIANTLRASNEFFKYCCRDYSVWKNTQTGKISVVQGKSGTAGFGWEFVKGDLCFDEAQALATADQYGDWKVWVRTSPCSGRYDWVTVARENPTGGENFYYLANQIFPGTNCTTMGCTFQQATAIATSIRTSPQFSNYCCRDYSVWQNTQTSKMTIVKGKFGTAGFGWQIVKTDLCCEEAEALAGIPGACSGTDQSIVNNTKCWPGSYAAMNPQTQKVECFCYPGLVWNNTRTACIDTSALVKAADCSRYSGSYAVFNQQTQKVECWCPEGKKWNSTMTACIDDPAKVNCWPGSYAAVNPQTQKIECYCNPGLVWNSTKTACVDPQELVKAADCSAYPGSYAAWNIQTQKVECWCPPGKKWNSTMTACIDDPGTITCWPGSHPEVNPQTQKTECYCNTGLVWNSTKTACVDPQELAKNTDCSVYPGSYAAWNTQTQKVECWCPPGKKWNDTKTACVDITTTTNDGSGTGGWTLVSATVSPEDPNKVWGNHEWTYSGMSPAAQYSIYNGAYKVNYSRTPPTQQFNSNGFTVSLNVNATATAGNAISGLISVSGSGLTSDTEDKTAYAKGTGSASASKAVNFKPASNYSDIEVKVVLAWGSVTYTYKYKRM